MEEQIQQQLADCGINAEYEPCRIRYIPPERSYTPDFVLPNGIVIETKGYFAAEDRTKHLLIKAQHPDIELRFIFQRPQTKLYTGSKTTYASWCDKHGFKWAHKRIPREWLDEPLNQKRIDAIKETTKTECAK